ncbi:MAG: 3-oxoacyl-ACP reductase [Candidatus Riflebacteria bacterium HGW-Riflebacteria-2]|jgi:3-oxoacyl-[acyl-carrier protein] reductase|nr:MAG: 3-oxoacyl-ACP reductase [Candidatus Riflebacteria bacterium HGW-Riflebacteria-2]
MRKILLTGASSEIGAAICRKIADSDDEMILHGFRNVGVLEQLRDELPCRKTVISAGNLADSGYLSDLIKTAEGCDILVNCAAVTHSAPLAQMSDAEVDLMISVNLLAMIRLCREVVPGMLARRNGSILNVSSVAASRGVRGQTVYAGTKGFIESFTRSLAAECSRKGVRVNCIAPGPIDAGSLKSLLSYTGDEVKKNVALNRLGRPEEVAAVAAFLLSESASFIVGEVVHVNGGFMYGL